MPSVGHSHRSSVRVRIPWVHVSLSTRPKYHKEVFAPPGFWIDHVVPNLIPILWSVIIKKSRKLNQTIAAASIRQIQSGLKKYYNKDLTERQILNVIRSLGRIVTKERDPRNHRKTLYRINPNSIEEATITLVKLNHKKTHTNNYFEGTLCYPLLSTEKKKFLAIGHKH